MLAHEGFALHIEGDFNTGLRLLPVGRQLIEKARRQKEDGQLHIHTAALFYEGSYLYCTFIGDQARLRIVVGDEGVVGSPVSASIPDFLSGAVMDHIITEMPVDPPPGAVNYPPTLPAVREFVPTPECERLHMLNSLNRAGPQPSRRLAVTPHWTFLPTSPALSGGGLFSQSTGGGGASFGSNGGGQAFSNLTGWSPYNPVSHGKESYAYGPAMGAPFIFTQWTVDQTVMPATMWSGKMRQLVQLLQGFGRQTARSVYGSFTPWGGSDYGDSWKFELEQTMQAQSRHSQDTKTNGLQIQYDMRWFRTHGLTKASDGQWWIVQISGTGVQAMPLPLWEETKREEFWDLLRQKNDTAAQQVINEFGGFPTGEAFRPGDAWVRAGRTLRLLPKAGVDPFYAGWSPFFILSGWAFSPTGDQAHNTHWKYGPVDEPLESEHWAILLDIGPTRKPDQSDEVTLEVAATFFSPKLIEKYPAEFEPAIWKIRYLTKAQIDTILAVPSIEGAFLKLVETEARPLATGTATLTRVSAGQIWSLQTIRGQPQFKYPDPDRGCLATFDLNPAGKPNEWRNRRIPCDAPIWVAYIQGALEVCRFSAVDSSSEATSSEPEEPCQYVGEFVWESRSTGTQPDMFYTSRYDDRGEIASSERRTVATGTDVGYLRQYYYDDLFQPQYCYVFRERGFLKRLSGWFRNGVTVASSILVPFGDREAYYYALYNGASQVSEWTQEWVEYLVDPNNATGGRAHLGRNPAWEFDPAPASGRIGPRFVLELNTSDPGLCGELADSGQWLRRGQSIEDLNYSLDYPVQPGTYKPAVPRSVTRVWLVSNYRESPFLVYDHEAEGDAALFPNQWFAPSPTKEFQAFLETTHNVFGERPLVYYYASMNADPRTRGKLIHPTMQDRGFSCIGVID